MSRTSQLIHTIHTSAAICVGLAGLVFVTSFPSPVEDDLITSGILTVHTFPVFASTHNLGCTIASIFTGLLTEYLGIKTAMILASVPGMLGAFLIALGYNGMSMIVGRTLTGVYLSFGFIGLPVYFVEIAEPSNKKLFGAMVPLTFRFSLLLLYSLGVWLDYTWLSVILLAMIAFTSFYFIFLPESPSWLRQKGMVARAETAIRYFYNPPETETDTQEVSEDPTVITSYFNWIIIRPMLVTLSIQMAVTCTTHEFLTAYSAHTLDKAVNINSHVAVLFYPLSLLFGSTLFMWLIHKVRWKKLLIITTCLQIVTDAIMSLTLYLSVQRYDCINQTERGWVCEVLLLAPMVLIFLIGLFFSLGTGSIAWWSYGNIVHLRYARVSTGIITLMEGLSSLINQLIAPIIALHFGNYVVFLSYSVILVIALTAQIFY